MKPPDFEILIATMNRTDLLFLDAMFKETGHEAFHILIINQTAEDRLLSSPYEHIRVVNAFEKGLSKSRNLALQHAAGDICLLADDDTCFIPGFDTVIQQAFNNHNADLIAFQIGTFEGSAYKKYPKNAMALSTDRHIEPLSSVEIAFKRTAITDRSVRFNELFGLNSRFEMGEEYLFARDALRAGLQLYYVPRKIVKHSQHRSTSNQGSDKTLYAKGALMAVKHPQMPVVRLMKFVFFLLRKGFIRWPEALKKLKTGIKGVRDYKKLAKFGS